jgi:hypothetical protein
MKIYSALLQLAAVTLLCACSTTAQEDGDATPPAGRDAGADVGSSNGGHQPDAAGTDAGQRDTGAPTSDQGLPDAGDGPPRDAEVPPPDEGTPTDGFDPERRSRRRGLLSSSGCRSQRPCSSRPGNQASSISRKVAK